MGSPDEATGELTARRYLKDLAAGERRRLRLAVLAGTSAGLLTIGQLVLMASFISRLLVEGAALSTLTPLLAGLMVVLPLRALALYLQETLAQVASVRIRQRVRRSLLDHLAQLGPVRLTSRHSASLANQLVEQVEALDGYFARFQPQLHLALLVPLSILLPVLWLDWLAAIFLLISAPLIPLFMALVGMGAERLNREQFAAVARLSGHFIDRVRGITTLQLFGRTSQATREVHAAADDYRQRSMRTLRLAFLSSAVLEFFASVAIAVVAIYVGFGLLGYIAYGPADELTLFSGLLVLLLAPEFFQPLRSLSQHYHDRAAALGAAEGLVALLTETPDARRMTGGAVPATSHDVLVELEAASVEHLGRGRVLGPVDLSLAAGEVVAVTGPSGVGKSTLLQLLAGFVAPASGSIRVAEGLRLAWMDQRPLLIQGSLADNLLLAAPDATEAEMRRALGRAGLSELLAALPLGLETRLGERGVGLSGGQAQRLALARVFLSRASLVLLDEPTASLDAETQDDLIEALQVLADEGRALVIATHHPALMALAKRRLSLEPEATPREVSHDAPA
ncbi:thiol reductant ABC exporter subunit CydD [Halomonas daqiaonensis]|uniref:ATP-binding cassette, subfamily C, CydD n=1 Tax=Halomonas daqiaonensis TaxID=650850 RepID=A0A1H7FYF8_9GAMM|nr:thiol reductant ABC exporter subunit CydD [Halomonas daqiaonensis]SEK30287.1 ATP-binding cassette, subfamily C, CydD [Halomonas daqiaonensis]